MAEITFTEVKRFNKMGVGKAGGHEYKFWLGDAFADSIVEGSSLDIEVQKKPDKDGKEERWITSVNGVAAKKQGGFGGGGRGKDYVPKSREEIHCSCITGILKSCIEQGDIELVLAAKAIALYKAEMKEYAP